MRIDRGDLSNPEVIALLELHVTRARAETAPGSAHALDPFGTAISRHQFLCGMGGPRVVGCGSPEAAITTSWRSEIHAHRWASKRRNGVGSAILRHIISEARVLGLTRLSLETGSWDYFEAARAFYKRQGFVACAPFGDYKSDPNSVFMTLELRGSV